MNYIDIKEAVKATGKSEKTIRRFLSKAESKPYIDKKDNKLLVDVNYLFASYPPFKSDQKQGGQKLDADQKLSIDREVLELKNKLMLYEQDIKHKEQLLNEKDSRIMDLQKAMLLLEAPKEQLLEEKKKKWWQF
jgi:hypothetical protein